MKVYFLVVDNNSAALGDGERGLTPSQRDAVIRAIITNSDMRAKLNRIVNEQIDVSQTGRELMICDEWDTAYKVDLDHLSAPEIGRIIEETIDEKEFYISVSKETIFESLSEYNKELWRNTENARKQTAVKRLADRKEAELRQARKILEEQGYRVDTADTSS